MTILALVAVVLSALVHVGIFVAESLRWRRPEVWRRFGVADQAAADSAKLLVFNQGFYNLFLAVGGLTGSVLVLAGPCRVGWTLIVGACASMAAAAVVLRLSGGAFYTRAAAVQATFPTIALLASLVLALT